MHQLTEIELLNIYAAYIEAKQINIAENYDEWLNVCFAAASCGEDGQDACHIISRQSNKYKTKDTRQKFRNALKTGKASGIGYVVNSCKKLGHEMGDILRWYNANYPTDTPRATSINFGNGTTQASTTNENRRAAAAAAIETGTLYAKNNAPELPSLQKLGGEAAKQSQNDNQELQQEQANTTKVNSKNYCPYDVNTLKRVTSVLDACGELRPLRDISSSDEQAVAAVWGFVAGCSAITRNTFIMYDGKRQHTHLYYLLCAPAASGKGILSDVRGAFDNIQARERERARLNWENYKYEYNNTPKEQRETIPRPKAPTFWLPADTSTSALISAIRDNDGGGCIWESEIDTINRAIKSDYGNYTDTLRNNYHGEDITYLRKTGREFIQLENTHFAACIAGTMGQTEAFFKSTENGLFSRWAFGTLSGGAEWADKFNVIDKSPRITQLQHIVAKVDNQQATSGVIQFTRAQQVEHGKYYAEKQDELVDTLGGAAVSFLRRQAVTQLRVAAVLNCIINDNTGYCCEVAWRLAASMAAHSVECGAYIIARLPESEAPTRRKDARANSIYKDLPSVFSAQDVPENVSRATYYRYIQEWSSAGKIIRDGKQWRKVA